VLPVLTEMEESTPGTILSYLVLMAAWTVPAVFELRPHWSHLRFRERLWPELPSGAVVSTATGAPVA
jgi:hypothetical protein